MVIAYIGGQPVGPQGPDSTAVLAWLAVQQQEAELRTDDGRVLGRFVPEPIVPWEPGVTREELKRRAHESPRMTLDDFWKKMGVK